MSVRILRVEPNWNAPARRRRGVTRFGDSPYEDMKKMQQAKAEMEVCRKCRLPACEPLKPGCGLREGPPGKAAVNTCGIRCNGVHYRTLQAFSDAHGVKASTMAYRLRTMTPEQAAAAGAPRKRKTGDRRKET